VILCQRGRRTNMLYHKCVVHYKRESEREKE
jgi:hypothetical protein